MEQTLVMDRQIVWSPLKLKEIDEAKSIYFQFKRLGHQILKTNGDVVERFEPSLGALIIKTIKTEVTHIMKILSDAGDEKIVWDKNNGKQAKRAKETFEQFLAKKYTAYSTDAQGKKKKQITEFDVDAEEIIIIPPTSRG